MSASSILKQISVIVGGHVDHGKSTLIGRLCHETGNLPDGKIAEIQLACDRRGVPFEWSFALDALQSERDQAVTIDTTRIWLRHAIRDIVLIDAPGHKEFLRNMLTGTSEADAALIVLDVSEVLNEQTKRHALLIHLFGIRQVVVAVNKMDVVDYSESRFEEVSRACNALFSSIGITATFIPTCAREGDNLVSRSKLMPWYTGHTIFDSLANLEEPVSAAQAPFRLSVQGLLRRNLRKIAVGQIQSGVVRLGDDVIVMPSRQPAKVESIESWPTAGKTAASAGESVGIILDTALFIDRGDYITHLNDAPVLSNRFRVQLFSLAFRPLRIGDHLVMSAGARRVRVTIVEIERSSERQAVTLTDGAISQYETAIVILKSAEVLALDSARKAANPTRFTLSDDTTVCGCGKILEIISVVGDSSNLVPVDHMVNPEARAQRNFHKGMVIWLTGRPASGKTTLAMMAERQLFDRGYHTYVLDGDDVRTGLSSDLGFSEMDRRENIRRVGETAALFANAGIIVIAAVISPFRSDRNFARLAAKQNFHEIYVNSSRKICEERDPKGHYRKARAGKLPNFTGVTSPYEPPENAELVLDTANKPVGDCVLALLEYIQSAAAIQSAQAIS